MQTLRDAYREVKAKHVVIIPALWHIDCSASSGRRHCDDVIKTTGGISRMWAELLRFTGV